MNQGMIRLKSLCCFLVLSLAASAIGAEVEPEWDFAFAESDLVTFEADQWHAKDYGWLFTCRLEVSSLNLLLPISHLELKGFNAAGEQIWSERSVVRRKDFKSSLVGRADLFVRILVKDAPSEVAKMELSYDDGREGPAVTE